MKKLINSLLLCVFTFTTVNGQQQQKGLEFYNLQQNVKKIVQYDYELEPKNNGFITLRETVISFDTKGNLIRKTEIKYPFASFSFSSKSDTFSELTTEVTTNEYTNNLLKRKITKSIPFSPLDHLTNFTYNKSGKILKEDKMTKNALDEIIRFKKQYTYYNNEGDLKEMSHYTDDGKEIRFFEKRQYSYSGNTKTEKTQIYDYVKGIEKENQTNTFINNRLVSEESIKRDRSTYKRTYIYKNDNLISETVKNSEGKTYGITNTYKNNKLTNIVQTYPSGSFNKKTYDSYGNLLTYNSFNNKNEKRYADSYNYAFDTKNNWIKKHSYESGKHYVSFREIEYYNQLTTGSLQFDKSFINQQNLYKNTSLVTIKKEETTANKPSFKQKNWNYFLFKENFKYVEIPSGTISLNVINGNDLSFGSKANVKITIPVKKPKIINFECTVIDYNFDTKEDEHVWSLRPKNNAAALLLKLKIPNKQDKNTELMVQLPDSLLEFIMK